MVRIQVWQPMKIKHSYKSRITGETVDSVYEDIDDVNLVKDLNINSVHAVCFYGDKIVLVYSAKKGVWSLPGGGVEIGENFEEAVIREVKEETNMKVIKQKIIGLQTNIESNGRKVMQTKSVCLVEPYGPFLADEDTEGDVTEIKIINPADYKHYFNWGPNSDRIIERAMEMVNVL